MIRGVRIANTCFCTYMYIVHGVEHDTEGGLTLVKKSATFWFCLFLFFRLHISKLQV